MAASHILIFFKKKKTQISPQKDFPADSSKVASFPPPPYSFSYHPIYFLHFDYSYLKLAIFSAFSQVSMGPENFCALIFFLFISSQAVYGL